MAIPLRARRALVFPAAQPASPSPRQESVWPIVVLSALTLVGFLLLVLVVYLVFRPGMTTPFG